MRLHFPRKFEIDICPKDKEQVYLVKSESEDNIILTRRELNNCLCIGKAKIFKFDVETDKYYNKPFFVIVFPSFIKIKKQKIFCRIPAKKNLPLVLGVNYD